MVASLTLLAWLLAAGARIAWFVALTPVLWVRAHRAVRLLRHNRAAFAPPLAAHPPFVFTPVAPLLAPAETRTAAPVVLLFTGTGETPYAAFEALQRLRAHEPLLHTAITYVFEVPSKLGAYANAAAFSNCLWDSVLPLVKRHDGPFVLVGMSRGALAALDLGARIAEEQTKVACVLALSPPLDVPARLPRAVTAMAGLENAVKHIAAACDVAPRWASRAAAHVMQRSVLLLTALVLHDLGVRDPRELVLAQADLALRDIFESSLRATREFRLLRQINVREAEIFANHLASVCARNPRYFAAFVWGAGDSWLDPGACQARIEHALHKEPRAQAGILLCRIANQGHVLFRAEGKDIFPSATALSRVVHEAQKRKLLDDERRHLAQDVELRARADGLAARLEKR